MVRRGRTADSPDSGSAGAPGELQGLSRGVAAKTSWSLSH